MDRGSGSVLNQKVPSGGQRTLHPVSSAFDVGIVEDSYDYRKPM